MAQSQGTPKTGPTDAEQALRTRADHDAIGRLADDLLPALIAKLALSGLGEIEVRQGGWKARLRKQATVAEPRKAAVAETAAHVRAVSHGRPEERERRSREAEDADQGKVVATSPAVGIYNPRHDLAAAMRVRSGDKIGTVDVLGVKQDVVSPVDGIIGSSLAEAGEAVEYGQELIRIVPPEATAAGDAPLGDAAAAGASAGAETVAVAGKA